MTLDVWLNLLMQALVGFGTVSACIISLVLANSDPRKKSVLVKDIWYKKFPGSFCFLVNNKRAFQIEINRIILKIPGYAPFSLLEEHGHSYRLDPYSEGKIELVSPVFAQLMTVDLSHLKKSCITIVTNLGGFEFPASGKFSTLLRTAMILMRDDDNSLGVHEKEALTFKRNSEYQPLQMIGRSHDGFSQGGVPLPEIDV